MSIRSRIKRLWVRACVAAERTERRRGSVIGGSVVVMLLKTDRS